MSGNVPTGISRQKNKMFFGCNDISHEAFYNKKLRG